MYHGVRTAVIHPGFTDTPMVRALGEEYIDKKILPYTQLKRLIGPGGDRRRDLLHDLQFGRQRRALGRRRLASVRLTDRSPTIPVADVPAPASCPSPGCGGTPALSSDGTSPLAEPKELRGSSVGHLDNPFTDLWLYPIKLANQAADWLFYDVGNLDPSEWARLSPLADLKGTIIVVSPRSAPRADRLRHYESVRRFMTAEGDRIGAIAVAGGGSSVLGTASLARSVADVTGCDVAGIVTGFGAAELVVESLGGFFLLGRIDRLGYEGNPEAGAVRDLARRTAEATAPRGPQPG